MTGLLLSRCYVDETSCIGFEGQGSAFLAHGFRGQWNWMFCHMEGIFGGVQVFPGVVDDFGNLVLVRS